MVLIGKNPGRCKRGKKISIVPCAGQGRYVDVDVEVINLLE